ncbi:protein FAM83C [Spea bombifrons]|uniref:protein FAM83C n=1 Tax=Spea bombifrons TaxID=233779 RepID=UPI002349DFED|nr:protein FAM83C [Spea bombifrons]
MQNPEARRGLRTTGQLRSRVEELKSPWRQSSPFVLNYNESARLATDALLEHGEQGYLQVLSEEKELPFLSSLDIDFICRSANVNGASDDSVLDGDGTNTSFSDNCPSELTSGTYFPVMSDVDAPALELGWPELPLATRTKGTEVQVIFQRHRSNVIKDLIRSLINKAKTVIAVVMDLFTDVEILCDLIEAATKRRVPVYLLLDEINIIYFIEMYEKLGFNKIHVSNMKIRTMTGDTYCTKSGKKFSGQLLEKFIIIDCEHVIAGAYSFSWLSSHVHSNMVTYFKGNIVEVFDREFRCLYADSLEADYFTCIENENPKAAGNRILRNRWAVKKSPPIPKRGPEISVESNSNSGSQSSVKTPPFSNNQAVTIIYDDKTHGNNYGRKFSEQQDVDILNEARRQSDPNTERNNLLAMQKLLLSKSTPILNDKSLTTTSSPLTPKFGALQKKPLQAENKTSPKMKSDLALNKICESQHKKSDPANAKNKEDPMKNKRMTLGHSKLDLITKYKPEKIYSRFDLVRK